MLLHPCAPVLVPGQQWEGDVQGRETLGSPLGEGGGKQQGLDALGSEEQTLVRGLCITVVRKMKISPQPSHL